MTEAAVRAPRDRRLLRSAYAEIRALRARLAEIETRAGEAAAPPVAIVGMACRFPGGVTTPDEFWSLLREGRIAVGDVPDGRWDTDFFYAPAHEAPGKMYTRRGHFVDDVDLFDARFFGITPREAERMDPQQRMLLEVSWEALERAGLATRRLAGSETGVFLGIITHDYADRMALAGDPRADPYDLTGNLASVAAGRVAYLLGLTGPCLSIDTTCSSSLVAVHLACQSLRRGECSAALAAGVNLILSPLSTISLCKMGALSHDGRCRTFDAAADGYGRGEGCGVVVLQRLSDARRDGSRVLAVIRGSAVNHDGRSNGLTVPSGKAQERVVALALADAGVEAAEIRYLEAHGTATTVGDPIEIHALGTALGAGRAPGERLPVGSVKANIGHLEAAAGVASLIKVALAVQHDELPPQPPVSALNPHVDWTRTPLQVVDRPVPWSVPAEARLAGISSFGFSGTNAHLIVAGAPPRIAPSPWVAPPVERPRHVLALSAKSEGALRDLAGRYVAWLASSRDVPFADLCFSAATGRSHFAHRLALVAATGDEARARLERWLAGDASAPVRAGRCNPSQPPRVAFLFTGQGAQQEGMGMELAGSQPTFRAALEECDAILRPDLDVPLLDVLSSRNGHSGRLHETRYTQPALFALEYAVCRLWQQWGIAPSAVLGHSIGELAAAWAAGVMDLDAGLQLVAARGRLMQSLPADGAMASVAAAEPVVADALAAVGGGVAIAAVNAPESVVISGRRTAVASASARLAAQGVRVQPLNVSHAFHSALLDPIADAFEDAARRPSVRAPRAARRSVRRASISCRTWTAA